METPNTEMLRGRVDIFVLKAISDSDGYGYDILNYIHDKTEGHYEMKQSSVYSVLKRLEKQGYIYSFSGNESNGAKRRYYALTDAGKSLLEDQEKEWAYTRTLLDNLVSDKSFDLKSDTPPFHPSDLRPMTRRAPKEEYYDVVSEPADTSETSVTDEVPVEKAEVLPDTASEETKDTQIPSSDVIQTEDTVQNPSEDVVPNETQKQKTVNTDENAFTLPLSTGYVDPTDLLKEADEQKRREAVATLYNQNVIKPSEPVEKNADPIKKDAFNGDKAGYRDFYNGLFGEQVDRSSQGNQSKSSDYVDIDCSHITDLKMKLEDEGIKLRSYDPSIPGKSTIKYLLTNKILRDTSVLGYLTLVIFLLIVGLVKSFQVSLTAILIVGGVGLLVPASCVLLTLNNPSKRVKDGLKLHKIVLSGLVAYIAVFIVSLIINLIIPNGNSLNTLPTYATAIITLFIPMSTLIFVLLYKSERYHLSNR